MNKSVFSVCTALALAGAANAQVRITEYAYQGPSAGAGTAGEFTEITNTGASPISLNTYSFDDNSRLAGSFALSGVLAPGASAIICELSEADFRTLWSLPASVLVFGGCTQNLSRSDECNIYDGATLVDRLTFNDQDGNGGPRTNNNSGITTPANWGSTSDAAWFLSALNDGYGSYASSLGQLGSPGFVPTPGAAALLGLGMIASGRRRR